MLCILCVFLRVYALPYTTLHLATDGGGVNGKVYLIIHELKTQTLVEVVEELLRGVKGFSGWVFLLYQNILSNILHSKILNIHYENIHKNGGGLKVRSTEEYLGHSWFAYLPILPGSAAGAAALKYYYYYYCYYMYFIYNIHTWYIPE